MNTEIHIRRISPEDNPAVADIIRNVMTEFGAVGCGFSIEDAEVDAMYEAYPEPDSMFYVIEWDNEILGCGGIGPLVGGDPGVCELKKMYFLPALRSSGFGRKLLELLLDDARDIGYDLCYLETLDTMVGARNLYLRFGFAFIDSPLGNTGHTGCNNFMTLEL
jgi:putative acetyltransferase